jgi:PhzF family phenazine biosynthesis protein
MKLFQVDAFADKLFAGNPAAICPVDKFLPDSVMQNIGMENNLAETAFIVRTGSGYDIRWFTPTVEVDLCGHATLASAHVVYNHLGYEGDVINFHSPRSGPLKVYRDGPLLTLDFPTDMLSRETASTSFQSSLHATPLEVWRGKTDLMLVFDNESDIRSMNPNFPLLAKLPCRGIIVTAKGNEVDFVSRFFGPQSGIDEDPVTGSAHTTLIPYWSKRLGKKELKAKQLSKRGGTLICKDMGDRVHISGQARTFLVGEIQEM